MRTADFDFELPDSAIARYPAERRDHSRLLRLDRATGQVSHHRFDALPDLLSQGDLLVSNDSKVLKARVMAKKKETGGKVQVLFIEPVEPPRRWRAMVTGAKRLRPGVALAVGEHTLTIAEAEGAGFVLLDSDSDVLEVCAEHGAMPLPPYLGRSAEPSDDERYQTVFAEHVGSVAAPTAGLHFTQGVLTSLKSAGVEQTSITLHVGPGTFLPVRADELDDHEMHAESFIVSEECASRVANADRVVAVGTTVVRTLESNTSVAAGASSTRLFIRPGFEFRHVGAMITNFHLPKSTLLMLVCAFAGTEPVLDAYRTAVAEGYRFYSYGDAMLIV